MRAIKCLNEIPQNLLGCCNEGKGRWRGEGKVTFTKLLFEIKKSLNLIYTIKFYKLKNFKQVNVEIYF